MTIHNLILYFVNLLIKHLLKITRKSTGHDNTATLMKKFIVCRWKGIDTLTEKEK